MGKTNKARPSKTRTEGTRAWNEKDEAVARDPDIGGTLTRTSYGPTLADRTGDRRR